MEITYLNIWRLYTHNGDTLVGAGSVLGAMEIFHQIETTGTRFKNDIKKKDNNIYFNPDDIGGKVGKYKMFLVNDKWNYVAKDVEQAAEYHIHYQLVNRKVLNVDEKSIKSIK